MSPTAFHLRAGGVGPIQQSAVSCGAACLVVARMLVDDALAVWIRDGSTGPDPLRGGPDATDPRTPAQRFAEAERRVMARTNAFSPRTGAAQLPWPRALGTPPWGALSELEAAAPPGVTYELAVLRHRDGADLTRAQRELASRVRPGAPALLYVGNAVLPRHVTLVFAGDDAGRVVYEPASGRVVALSGLDLAGRALDLAGWDHPWALVQPGPAHPVTPRAPALHRLAPQPATGGVASRVADDPGR